MKLIDKKIKKVKALQAELDRRTTAENEAIQLISECKFEEAREIFDSGIFHHEKGGKEG